MPSPASPIIRVVVVEVEALVRAGIAASLHGWKRHRVSGLAHTSEEARRCCEQVQPSLIVIGLPMPACDGFGLLRELLRRCRDARVVVVGTHDDQWLVEHALKAGASGFIRRCDEVSELRAACADRENVFLSHAVQQTVLRRLVQRRQQGDESDRIQRLSERELAVFDAMGRGLRTKEIASALSLSVKTIETHQAHVREKVGATSMQELREMAKRRLTGNEEAVRKLSVLRERQPLSSAPRGTRVPSARRPTQKGRRMGSCDGASELLSALLTGISWCFG